MNMRGPFSGVTSSTATIILNKGKGEGVGTVLAGTWPCPERHASQQAADERRPGLRYLDVGALSSNVHKVAVGCASVLGVLVERKRHAVARLFVVCLWLE